MDHLERFYRIDQLLNELGVVPRDVFLKDLEVSPATFKRDLEYMRDRFNAPIVWDADAGGYRYAKQGTAGPRFALPGLWFNEAEAFALITMEHLLSSLDKGGLIGPHIAPLPARLAAIRRDGFAISIGETVRGAAGLAAPIFNADGSVSAGLLIGAPIDRFEQEMPELKRLLREATARVSGMPQALVEDQAAARD